MGRDHPYDPFLLIEAQSMITQSSFLFLLDPLLRRDKAIPT